MHPKAVQEAKLHLKLAAEQCEKLQSSLIRAEEMSEIWPVFLFNTNVIFEKLKAGAAGNSASTDWFDHLKKLREADDLLRYIHHARNSVAHNFNDREDFQDMAILPVEGVTWLVDGQLHGVTTDTPIGTTIATLSGFKYKLLPVTDKWGTFQPATLHLEQPIDGTSPFQVAQAVVSFLGAVVEDAEALAA